MKIIWILFFIFFGKILSAQTDRLGRISTKQGLSQGMILDAIQDSEGYLWFCTKDGLNRYDGYSMQVFTHDAQDSFSISANELTCIFEDSRGWIWVGTPNRGLSIYDRYSGRFFHFKVLPGNGESLQSESIQTIAEDPLGNIWIGSEKGLDKLLIPGDLKLNKQENASINDKIVVQPVHQLNELVSSVYFENDTVYWGTVSQLYSGKWNNSGSDFKIKDWKLEPQNKDNFSIVKILRDSFGALWLVHPHSLSRIHMGKVRYYRLGISINKPMMGFFIDKNGNFLIGHTKVYRYAVMPNGDLSGREICDLGDLHGSKLFEDKSGILWIGTNGFGVLKYNPHMNDFRHYMKGSSLQHMIADSAGRLYVWSHYQIHILDLKSGKSIEVPNLPKELLRARNVLIDTKGRYWFHFPYEEEVTRLHVWDPVSGTQKQFPYSYVPNSLSFIYEDHDGHIWMSARGGILMRLNQSIEKFEVTHLEKIPELKGQSIINNCIIQTKDNTFWLGTSSGLVSFKWIAGKAEHLKLYQNQPHLKNSLSDNHILHLLQDSIDRNIIWIGTKGGGLNKMNIAERTFSHIKRKDGLPNDVVYGMLRHKEKLWLSTNKGLAVYEPSSGKIQNYTAEEGLQDDEFNTFSFCNAGNGLLVFGGINGMNVIEPDKISTNTTKPNIVITMVLAGINPVTVNTIENKKSIPEFAYDQNLFSFSFAALDFTATEKNEYKYMLQGADAGWVYAGNRNEVHYTHLKPGKYTFKVLGSNNSGLWADEPAVWQFTILPPWWRTWWAYSLYVLIIGYSIWSFYRFQLKKIQTQKQLEFEKNEAERLAEVDRMKTNFFSNITHEFRTPLTLILEPIRQLIPEQTDEPNLNKLKLAEKNSLQLLHLVNQLLDLSKLEGGYMELEMTTGDMIDVVESTFTTFRPLADKKGIEMELKIPEESLILEFDRSKLELILNNLLSNAVKFTPEGGSIILKLQSESLDSEKSVVIKVYNSGPGIPAELKDKIFDRFYQVDDSSTGKNEGTGIGLSLTKELITLMGGSIELRTENRSGTEFVVRLPRLEAKAPEESKVMYPSAQASFVSENKAVAFIPDETNSAREIILVVEDNPELRAFICDTLKPKYKIIEAENGQIGIDKAIELIPDLIISDLMMPLKNGFELCETIKREPLTAHIPVILLTAKSAMDSKIMGLKTGADDYLTKPFHTEELYIRIQNLIESRKQLRQKYAQEWRSDNEISVEKPSGISETDMELINKMYEIIDTHLDQEDLTTDEIAKKMLLSRVQLHRKIKAIFDQSTSEFVRNYRLDKARGLLLTKSGNVNEIAAKVGIPNRNYFTKTFRERFGILPSEI